MAASSRTLALGTAGILAGLVAIVTIRALRDGSATEPPAAASTFKPAAPSSSPSPAASTPAASAAMSAAPSSSPPDPSTSRGIPPAFGAWDGGKQVYDLEEHAGGQKSGPGIRPIDREIFDYIASGRAKPGMNDDIFPKQPYRVKVFRIVANGPVTHVWIDMNRNGKWDERWDLKADQVDRHIADADDENYDTDARLRNGRWLPY